MAEIKVEMREQLAPYLNEIVEVEGLLQFSKQRQRWELLDVHLRNEFITTHVALCYKQQKDPAKKQRKVYTVGPNNIPMEKLLEIYYKQVIKKKNLTFNSYHPKVKVKLDCKVYKYSSPHVKGIRYGLMPNFVLE